ncbi:hypothetical protein PspLS_11622 [Pyricularia sp. CBS 133598]|nr:hypothetical protein PspLS_11622 [Pyricularia sp. CBS 133598]
MWIGMGEKVRCFRKIMLTPNLAREAALMVLKARVLKQFNHVDVERMTQAVEDAPPPKGKNPKTVDAMRELRRNEQQKDYKVGIICAIGFEMSAVRYMLDKEHPRLHGKDGDPNIYTLGEFGGHNVILACLPGTLGKGVAATVATNMARSFPSIN